MTQCDIDEFNTILDGRVLTDPSDVEPYNIDWLRIVRYYYCSHYYNVIIIITIIIIMIIIIVIITVQRTEQGCPPTENN